MAHKVTQSEWENEVSQKILRFVKDELYLDMRFMDMVLSGLTCMANENIDTFATDGSYLYYYSGQVIRAFKVNSKFLNRLYLHTVLHCVYGHLWICGERDRTMWDIACDIIVEYTIDVQDKKSLKRPASYIRQQVYERIKNSKEPISAAVVYREIYNLEWELIEKLQREFYTDSHIYWPREEKMSASEQESRKKWDKISRQTQMELEKKGDDTDNGARMFENQIKANKSKRRYADFLRKFMVFREEMHCDPDEFDMNYYTFGLRLYKNMPLIEPVETREIMKIQEFVIVIDTSYSTSGELVKSFMNETFTILSEKNSFFNDCRLRIIQCDDDIRMDVEISDRAQLEHIINNFKIVGGGGTDFRPAFRYVNNLIEEKKLKNMRGLLYFTDGKGIYPSKRPDYKTAFIFAGDFDRAAVPAWAICMRVDLPGFFSQGGISLFN